MKISCAVVAYRNSPEQIGAVLNSLANSVDTELNLELLIMLIDNSPDCALESVAKKHRAEYHHQPKNPGFAVAHNLAIQHAIKKGTIYHLVLNPDVQFSQEVVPAIVRFMEVHPDIGLVMPDIRYPNGERQFLCKLLPAPVDLIMRRFLPGLYTSLGLLAHYELHESGYDKVMEVPALSGCFMLMRTNVLRKVGGFDERFFMYLEDVDLCRRIGRVAKTVYYPHVSIIHEYAKGSYKSWKPLFNHVKSAILYFNKWGWFFDPERRETNRRTLQKLQAKRTSIELQ